MIADPEEITWRPEDRRPDRERRPAEGSRHRDGFQSYAPAPHMTVRDNMAFGLKLKRPRPTSRRVKEAAGILSLEKPSTASRRSLRRPAPAVALGRAIVRSRCS
jgi:ABC-type taurine transport system ATPase subunit